MMEKVALFSQRVTEAGELPGALARAFALFSSSRPGPVHIEIPTDVMVKPADGIAALLSNAAPPAPDGAAIAEAARLIAAARRPLILAGGGAKRAEAPLQRLAERLGAPVVQTANARGLLHAPSALRAGQPQPEGGARADGRRRSGHRRRHRIRPDRL